MTPATWATADAPIAPSIRRRRTRRTAAAAAAATVLGVALAVSAGPAFAASVQAGAETSAPSGWCETVDVIDWDFDYPDFEGADPVDPEGGWFRVLGQPGADLCVTGADGRPVTAGTFDADGRTEPIYFTWGQHEVWQANDQVRSTAAMFNLDCWDEACLP